MKIVVLDGYVVNFGDLNWDELRILGECEIYDCMVFDEVFECLKDVEVIFINKVVIMVEYMVFLFNLKYIGVIVIGYNIIDVVVVKECGIIVINIFVYSIFFVG